MERRIEINIISSDEEEDETTLDRRLSGLPTVLRSTLESNPGKRKAKDVELLSADSDEECVEVSPPDRSSHAAGSSMAANSLASPSKAVNDEADSDGDDDVIFQGRKGDLALSDFPHARENCATFRFTDGPTLRCANCYCFVCDQPAPTCPKWIEHCHATHTSARWRQEREAWKLRASSASASSSSASASASSSAAAGRKSLPTAHVPGGGGGVISCEVIMKRVEQVFPIEAAAPPKLKATLRPYQAQSLAFMIQVETTSDLQLLGGLGVGGSGAGVRGGWLCDEVGMGKTCVCAALMLAQPAPKPTGEALAAMRNLFGRSLTSKTWTMTIGGTLYSTQGHENDLRAPEMLMTPLKEVTIQEKVEGFPGKYITRTRMELDKYKPKRPNPEFAKWTKPEVVTLPVTVVLTTNALLGQWQDELAKFAPSLRVRWYYGTTKPKIYADLMNTDVVLSTHGTTMFTDGGHHLGKYIRVHRIIIDECHGRDAIAHATSSLRERATGSESMGGFRFAWGVTGTPLSSSVKDLYQMADLIGQWDGGLQLRKYHDDDSCRSELPGVLQRLMIRHTKAQRIGGQVALALPDADCATVWVDMSPSERRLYDESTHRHEHKLASLIEEPKKAKTFSVETALNERRQACCGAGVLPRWTQGNRCYRGGHKAIHPSGMNWHAPTGRKLQVLVDDLEQLRATEPALHAVVFTHHLDAYAAITKRLAEAGFVVCGFTGGVSAKERHRSIREFQESAEACVAHAKGAKKAKVTPPKVFVATMKAGNVGMTLTAATRVYLMEPCLDPSMEVQAAGRIHRLGQTKEVFVKKLCYKHSLDGAIVHLHKELSAGTLSIVDNQFPVEALRILQADR
jgi:superfamily II DNA or RNA helicase